jgi:hypothetical protein
MPGSRHHIAKRTAPALGACLAAAAGLGGPTAAAWARQSAGPPAAAAAFPRVTLDLREVPLKEALARLFAAAGTTDTFVLADGLGATRPVTLALKDQSFEAALGLTLRAASPAAGPPLVFEKSGTLYRIKAPAPPLFSVNVKDAPLRRVLEDLFTRAKVDYAIDNNVGGFVTIRLSDRPLAEALTLVLRAASPQLAWSLADGVYTVRVRALRVSEEGDGSGTDGGGGRRRRGSGRRRRGEIRGDPPDVRGPARRGGGPAGAAAAEPVGRVRVRAVQFRDHALGRRRPEPGTGHGGARLRRPEPGGPAAGRAGLGRMPGGGFGGSGTPGAGAVSSETGAPAADPAPPVPGAPPGKRTAAGGAPLRAADGEQKQQDATTTMSYAMTGGGRPSVNTGTTREHAAGGGGSSSVVPRDSDAALVQRAAQGDTDAFGQLVERYQRPMTALVAR